MHMMASQKQSLPSFASILSVLSIVFYCAGFLRVELELNEQKKRINALESTEETKPSDVPNSPSSLRALYNLGSMGKNKCHVHVAFPGDYK